MNITPLNVPLCMIGEGPVWDETEQALYWIDILGKAAHRHVPHAGETHHWTVPQIIGSLAVREQDGLIVALADGIYELDLVTGACTLHATCEDLNESVQLADGKVERIIEMPIKLPASVMFGGANLDRLFVPTLSPAFLGRPADPRDGTLYVIDGLGIKGLSEPRYRG